VLTSATARAAPLAERPTCVIARRQNADGNGSWGTGGS
jgi:hypothetical protein